MANPTTETTDLPPPRKKSIIWRLLAGARFFTFVTALVVLTSLIALPEDNPLIFISSIPTPGIIVGLIVGAMIFAAGAYFFLLPGNSASPTTTFDLESVSAIIIGMLAILFLGLTGLFTSSEPTRLTIPAFILFLIYSFYLYRILKETILVKRENEKIRKKYGELVEIDLEKSDFITVTSHQLRTPLTEIKWSLEAVIRKNESLEDARILQKSLESVDRLIGIVNQMLGTHAFTTGNHSLTKGAVDAEQVINEVIRELNVLAEKKQVSVSFSPPERQILLDADREQIKMTFFNIVDNAIRYSPQGTVRISLEGGRDMANIRIEDTGIGINEADQQRVFTRFFRAPNALLVEPDGSGIGLHASKTVIEKHGGSINFFSQPGQGTKFIISLPVAH